MNPSIKTLTIPAAVALTLAACGGGGGGAKPAASLLPDAERARTLTGYLYRHWNLSGWSGHGQTILMCLFQCVVLFPD